MPVIAPPLKLMFSAALSPFVAAWAVRELARTDTNMPMNPATPDRIAPMAKPMAVSQLPSPRPTARKRTTPTMAMVVY